MLGMEMNDWKSNKISFSGNTLTFKLLYVLLAVVMNDNYCAVGSANYVLRIPVACVCENVSSDSMTRPFFTMDYIN